uniref:DNA2/NAM7 helicase-like C-terminal domain-containing protein n=1 Tax=Timema monikensis TaxID=170555 RepID=A0A7R9EHA9_9NEOP|nr:unnamed protein product [Timema monikensis]
MMQHSNRQKLDTSSGAIKKLPTHKHRDKDVNSSKKKSTLIKDLKVNSKVYSDYSTPIVRDTQGNDKYFAQTKYSYDVQFNKSLSAVDKLEPLQNRTWTRRNSEESHYAPLRSLPHWMWVRNNREQSNDSPPSNNPLNYEWRVDTSESTNNQTSQSLKESLHPPNNSVKFSNTAKSQCEDTRGALSNVRINREIKYSNTQSSQSQLGNNSENPMIDFKDKPKIFGIVKMLAMLSSGEMDDNKASKIIQVCSTSFLECLANFINNFQNEFEGMNDSKSFLCDLLTFLCVVLKEFPLSICQRFDKAFENVEELMKHIDTSNKDSLSEKLNLIYLTFKCQLKLNLEKKELIYKQIESKVVCKDRQKLSIFPKINELFNTILFDSETNEAFQNIEEYLNVHYVSVQKSLFGSFRDGIMDYINETTLGEKTSVKTTTHIMFYHNVLFMNPYFLDGKVYTVINLIKDQLPKSDISFSVGTLLCFTKDRFKTVIYATVVCVDETGIKEGIFVVELLNENACADHLYAGKYVMAISHIDFKHSFYVLEALKKKNTETFPEKYTRLIIDRYVEIKTPPYLIKKPAVKYSIRNIPKQIPVLNTQVYPSEKKFKLDVFQIQAFKTALTKELAIIDGLPGSGKKYLGTKLVEVLLDNSSAWQEVDEPILVLCHSTSTMESILESLLPVTDQIVLVTNKQTLNSKLQQFHLLYKRSEAIYPKLTAIINMRDNLQKVISEMKQITSDMSEISKANGILNLQCLIKFEAISRLHCAGFCQLVAHPEEIFYKWLMLKTKLTPQHEKAVEKREVDSFYEMRVNKEVSDIERDFKLDQGDKYTQLTFAETVLNLEKESLAVNAQMRKLQDLWGENGKVVHDDILKLLDIYEDLKKLKSVLKRQLSNEVQQDLGLLRYLLKMKNVHDMKPKERWLLYRHWVSKIKTQLWKRFQQFHCVFLKLVHDYELIRYSQELEIMRNCKVLGMTIDQAVKHYKILEEVKSKIVIVEEANAIPEADLVVCLSKDCSHLILIGNYQPGGSRTGLSLMDRLVRNGVKTNTLSVQHRSPPEMCRLLVPTIYGKPEGHCITTEHSRVQGMCNNVFFVKHNKPEKVVQTGTLLSYQNVHEAQFLLALSRYLLLQRYSSEHITILTPFVGQWSYLQNVLSNSPNEKVQVKMVNDFEGKENSLILLSLVRSNGNGKIDEMKNEKLVCTMLSRAKKGLYIIGDIDTLAKCSPVWFKIQNALVKEEAIGEFLTLRCRTHPDHLTQVLQPQDFDKSQKCGCSLSRFP